MLLVLSESGQTSIQSYEPQTLYSIFCTSYFERAFHGLRVVTKIDQWHDLHQNLLWLDRAGRSRRIPYPHADGLSGSDGDISRHEYRRSRSQLQDLRQRRLATTFE